LLYSSPGVRIDLSDEEHVWPVDLDPWMSSLEVVDLSHHVESQHQHYKKKPALDNLSRILDGTYQSSLQLLLIIVLGNKFTLSINPRLIQRKDIPSRLKRDILVNYS
jgi:hypothetical protein